MQHNENYIRFKFDTKKGASNSFVRLYPLVCLHLGAPQCDFKFITEHIERLRKDPQGYGLYLGDGGECVTKFSKGDVYGQLMSPQQQMDVLVEMLEPVLEKMLFGIRGNHGHRVYKETGLSFDKTLCNRLGIPYMGPSCFVNLTVNRSTYDLFFHHGADSGTALQAKIRRAELFMDFIDVDAVFTAHSHIAVDLPPVALLSCDNNARKVRTKLRHQYVCGSGYDSRTGYATEKGYKPILPSYITVKFDGRTIEGKAVKAQESQIFRSDGQHDLEHNYIFRDDTH